MAAVFLEIGCLVQGFDFVGALPGKPLVTEMTICGALVITPTVGSAETEFSNQGRGAEVENLARLQNRLDFGIITDPGAQGLNVNA